MRQKSVDLPGKKKGVRRLQAKDVKKIWREYYDDSKTSQYLSRKYDITESGLRDIFTGRTWRDITQHLDKPDATTKRPPMREWQRLTTSAVRQIWKAVVLKGKTQRAVASKWCISEPAVNHIIRGRTHKETVSALRVEYGRDS